MLGMGNFLDFFGKNPAPGKWHSGMQTSTNGNNIFEKSSISFKMLVTMSCKKT